MQQKIIILDFGSQTTQLIGHRLLTYLSDLHSRFSD